MKCPKCSYVFSEEYTQCLRCGNSMTLILEVLGNFPRPANEPFLSVEDFEEKPTIEEEVSGVEETTTEKKASKEIEFNLPE
ncbi:hypothetical protein [Thermodesulfobacterium hveragerdense]|uniref:hypothetical protein n=1 Tax=Thermodesulfobacterium hveragerdense TaxID=53424 RepID=UPI00042A86DF|nr:hypothetical protein [Thermodesulfobacterium hveragerdense]